MVKKAHKNIMKETGMFKEMFSVQLSEMVKNMYKRMEKEIMIEN
jgi:hypothetical protein